MNWGNKLLLVFVVFSGGLSYMTYRCMHTPLDLVSEHYYKDELAYQHVIDGTRKANALSREVGVGLRPEGIRVQLPPEMDHLAVRGTVQLYCPSDAARDRELAFSIASGGGQDIAVPNLTSGRYIAKIAWTAGGIAYFHEQPLIVP